jgi:hypothetical protein
MSRFSVLLEDATLLRGVEESRHPSTPLNSVASFITTKHRGILQHHEAAWHPSPPRSTVASFNTTEQRGILQHHEHAAPWC